MARLVEAAEIPKYHLAVYQNPTTENVSLWEAAKRGDAAGVSRWLKAGGCANYYNEHDGGLTPVHVAAESGDEATLQALLDFRSADAAMIAQVNVESTVVKGTPLHSAAQSGETGCVKMLLKQGANIEARNAYGNTPLHVACASNRVECVRELVNSGADVRAKSSHQEETPLHMAIAGVMASSRRLSKDETKEEEADLRIASLLVKSGADVNAADVNGATPLHVVVSVRENDAVFQLGQFLLKNGADPKLKDVHEKRPSEILRLRAGSGELLDLLKSRELFIV